MYLHIYDDLKYLFVFNKVVITTKYLKLFYRNKTITFSHNIITIIIVLLLFLLLLLSIEKSTEDDHLVVDLSLENLGF